MGERRPYPTLAPPLLSRPSELSCSSANTLPPFIMFLPIFPNLAQHLEREREREWLGQHPFAMVDGHVALVFGGAATYVAGIHGVMNRGWGRQFINTHPILAVSCGLFFVAVSMPPLIVPMRRSMGMPTNQWEAHHENCSWPVKFEDQRRKIVKAATN